MEHKENKTERVQMLMSPAELKAIDDWGFENRIRTRAEAIRRLCEIGLFITPVMPRMMEETTAMIRAIREKGTPDDVSRLFKEHAGLIRDILFLGTAFKSIKAGDGPEDAVGAMTKQYEFLDEIFGKSES